MYQSQKSKAPLVIISFIGIIIGFLIGAWLGYEDKDDGKNAKLRTLYAAEIVKEGIDVIHVKRKFLKDNDVVIFRVSTLPLAFEKSFNATCKARGTNKKNILFDSNGNAWRAVEEGDTIRQFNSYENKEEIFIVCKASLFGKYEYNGQEFTVKEDIPILAKTE